MSRSSILATAVDTAIARKTVTSSSGDFLFQDLPLGIYTVTVTFPGFSTAKYDKIPVSAGTIYTLPVKLALSSAGTIAAQIGPIRKGYQGQKPMANWLDPAAFADPAAGTFGTTRRNAYYGPGYSNVDFSVFKDVKVKEFVTLQLRAEMFNLFNRVNYAPPGGGYASAGGDFSLGDTIGDYNGAPGIGAGEAFNTQLGAKIIF